MTKSAHAYMNGRTMAAGTFGFLVASSIGAALGMLFAPKAGSETRAELSEKARQLAWRFKRSRAELQDNVRAIFGKINDDLEKTYLQVRDEIMAQMDTLEPEADAKTAHRHIAKSVVAAAAKGKRWTKAQIDKFIAHLENEYKAANDEENS